MAADDRKRRILAHLKESTNGTQYISPKKTSKPTPTPSPTPSPPPPSQPTPTLKLTSENDRKRRIMIHVQSSSGDFGNFSLNDETRKKKIEDHIRKSLS